MKEAFKKCMRYLYPQGVEEEQQIDLIKVFTMGYWEAALLNSPETLLVQLEKQLREIAIPNWQPDLTWKWW